MDSPDLVRHPYGDPLEPGELCHGAGPNLNRLNYSIILTSC